MHSQLRSGPYMVLARQLSSHYAVAKSDHPCGGKGLGVLLNRGITAVHQAFARYSIPMNTHMIMGVAGAEVRVCVEVLVHV